MKKPDKKKPPSKKAAKNGAPTEPPTAVSPNLMERARQRVESSRQAALNKAVSQTPE